MGSSRSARLAILAALIFLLPPSAFAEGKVATFLAAAYRQIGVTRYYDGSYRKLSFPGGDVASERGVCTDVLVRAYRAIGVDLQLLVHEDMSRAFRAYPRIWGENRPDPNIDHRRVPNLATFLSRHGRKLPVTRTGESYSPGDIVTWRLPSGVPHIGIVSDRQENDRPLIVHNIGAGAQIEDMLFAYPITGHYRYLPGEA